MPGVTPLTRCMVKGENKKLSFKVKKLRVGKGKTVTNEKQTEWQKKYYELEVDIEDEHDIELAKASAEGLIDGWLTPSKLTTQPQPQHTRSTWSMEKILWKEETGPKGIYFRSEDVNNPEFKAMLRDLQSHKGKMYRDGFFYWVFQNGSTVGRKQK